MCAMSRCCHAGVKRQSQHIHQIVHAYVVLCQHSPCSVVNAETLDDPGLPDGSFDVVCMRKHGS
jgi:hypothetical protein